MARAVASNSLSGCIFQWHRPVATAGAASRVIAHRPGPATWPGPRTPGVEEGLLVLRGGDRDFHAPIRLQAIDELLPSLRLPLTALVVCELFRFAARLDSDLVGRYTVAYQVALD